MDKNALLKGIAKGLLKSLPKIVEKLTEKTYEIKDLTAMEHVGIFLSNPHNPQCFITTTPLAPEEVLRICGEFYAKIKAQVFPATTKDDWQVLIGVKGETFFALGAESYPHRFMISVKREEGAETMVIIGCRFTASGKIDVFKTFEKGALERVRRVAALIQPNAGLENLKPS